MRSIRCRLIPCWCWSVEFTGNTRKRSMRFGIYCEIQTPPGKSHYDMIWEIMRQIEHAEECGFDVYSVIDHHFFQKFSISANPLAMLAAAEAASQVLHWRHQRHYLPHGRCKRLGHVCASTIAVECAGRPTEHLQEGLRRAWPPA